MAGRWWSRVRRTSRELAYVLVTAPVTALGFAWVLIGAVVAAVLSVTALGVPVLAAMVPATRAFARARRALAARLIGEVVVAPPPFRADPGVFLRLRAGLRDGPGWRAVAFHVVALPLSLLELSVVLFTWSWGLVAVTAPVQHALDLNQSTVGGRHGLLVGNIMIDTWPGVALFAAGGAALLALAPRSVRAVLVLDRLLLRALLSRDDRTARIAALERSRTAAVENAATTLRRIERDLHDGVQARLVAVTMNLAMLGELLTTAPPRTRDLLRSARATAQDAIVDLRDVIRDIHPPILDNGLDAAVATLAARSPVPVDCDIAIDDRPAPAIESIAYFCVAELLTNVAKHSDAGAATVAISQSAGMLRLVVTDNGGGGADEAAGSGLRGLAARVATVDGTLTVISPRGGPTMVSVVLPTRP
ncbi:sensor domain-containing protein [Asanoa sp. NPDC049518]|uniref:sensor histidine kinase n=1 Tax=unclassified Asanoa TaxID=2685164 RepID=UPI00343C8086